MKILIAIISVFLCLSSFSQKESSRKLSFFISPTIFQFENTDDWIETINSNYVSISQYNIISSEIGLNYTYQCNKIKFGGGLALKNYTMKFDIGFSQFDISNRNVNLFYSKPIELKSNSIGVSGIIGYKLTKTTDVSFILNYYKPFYIRNNTNSGTDGEIGVADVTGFNAFYRESSSSFRRSNFIPEINITTSLINGFYLNYGVKSKIRKRNYFSASITGQTSSSSDLENLLVMNAYSRHTAFYIGIGYLFDLKQSKEVKID
jgi:hypothetical protein|tara:strand:- start:1198 stop:1983 length:786 start_codon:yes stop_codon:yes gene_type:complete